MYLLNVTIHGDQFPNCNVYPFTVPVVARRQELAFTRPVTFFLGENGSGKSTLLDAISRKCGIGVWDKPRRHTAHHNPYETSLADYVSVTWADGRVPGSLFRAETYHDLADFLDDVALCDPDRLGYQGGHLLNTLSHGQGMLAYFAGRFRLRGLYLLDEPESALSPANQLKFLGLLQQLQGQGHVQFIIATHSPLLLACPGAQILDFDSPYIKEVAYEDTAHYRIYSQFFADRSAFLSAGETARV